MATAIFATTRFVVNDNVQAHFVAKALDPLPTEIQQEIFAMTYYRFRGYSGGVVRQVMFRGAMTNMVFTVERPDDVHRTGSTPIPWGGY